MWQYDPNLGDMVWVEPTGSSSTSNVPANIASLVPSGGTVQQNMAASLQGGGAEGGEMMFNPDGTYTISTPLADNQFLNTIVDAAGNQISQNVSSGEDTGLQDLAAFAAIPLTAGGFGGILGGALTGGALTGTAANALGNALISGAAGAISGQDPLKAALLAAGGTYAGGLFGGTEAANTSTLTDAQFIAADAAQLAAQGLGVDQIEQVLRSGGVNLTTAIAAADAATSGLPVNKIAEEITLGNRGLFTDTVMSTTPAAVSTDAGGLQTVTTTGAAPVVNTGGLLGGLAAAAPASVASQVNPVLTGGAPVNQQVTVTGTQQPTLTNDTLAAVLPAAATVSSPTTPQVVNVTGTKTPEQQQLDKALEELRVNRERLMATIAAATAPQTVTTTGTKATTNQGTSVVPAVVTPAVTPIAPATAPQVVEVTGTAKPPTTTDDLAAAIAATVNPAAVTTGATTTVNPADQIIETTGTKNQTNTGNLASALTTGVSTDLSTGASGGGVETQDQTTRTENQNTNTLTIADIIKALTSLSSLGLLGGGGGSGTAVAPMAPTTPVPVGNADYYKAIQQYYNTYMPSNPRDVATPLQQWYEGKFGG